MRLLASFLPALAAALLGPAAAADPAPAPATTSPAEPAPVLLPVIAPEDALAGRPLAEALRAGGLVLFMRHAEQVVASDKDDCSRHLLTPAGDAQSRTVGDGLRRLGVPIAEVLASPICRALQTAVLLGVGEPRPEPDLAPPQPRVDTGPARMRLLGRMPPPGRNTLLVSHQQGSRVPEQRLMLGLAEVLVFRPQPDGTSKPLARVAPAEWEALAAAVGR